jgi:hypothetical protein
MVIQIRVNPFRYMVRNIYASFTHDCHGIRIKADRMHSGTHNLEAVSG